MCAEHLSSASLNVMILHNLTNIASVVVATANQSSSEDNKKTSTVSAPSYQRDDVSTRQVVQLSKLPDAHEPCDGEIPAIERADWPAPPHPAAAYPELRKCTSCFVAGRGVLQLIIHGTNGHEPCDGEIPAIE